MCSIMYLLLKPPALATQREEQNKHPFFLLENNPEGALVLRETFHYYELRIHLVKLSFMLQYILYVKNI